LGFLGFLGFLKKPKKPRFFKTQFYSPGLNHGLNSKERVEDLWVTYLHLPEVAERKCFCGCVWVRCRG